MTRLYSATALACVVLLTANRFGRTEEPKTTKTVDIASSVPDIGKLQAFSGTGVIAGQAEWQRLAAAWGIKNVPEVDFNKELLLVGTWRGSAFKFIGTVKDGDLSVELVGDKDVQPGFRYKVVSLDRTGITKFQGVPLPAKTATEVKPIGVGKPAFALSGDVSDRALVRRAPSTGVIVSPREYEILVKAWGIKDAPKVDFTKEILVVGTSESDSFELTPALKDGDLTVTTVGSKETRDGFRWKVISIQRDGIKTVRGVALPKP